MSQKPFWKQAKECGFQNSEFAKRWICIDTDLQKCKNAQLQKHGTSADVKILKSGNQLAGNSTISLGHFHPLTYVIFRLEL